MVVEEGETDVEPLVALLVEKLVPVHEEAFVELQVSHIISVPIKFTDSLPTD